VIGSPPSRRERARALLRRARFDPRTLLALARTRPGRWYYRLALSWALWPALGALAALWRRTVLRHTPVVAVVGSHGKTTTRFAIAAALGQPPPRDGENSWSYVAFDLLRGRKHRPLVVEVGISRPGQMASYARVLRPDIVVTTAIGRAHWSSFGSVERIAYEKSTMLSALRRDGLAIVNGDDPRLLTMLGATTARVVRCGLGAGNDLRAETLQTTPTGGTSFDCVMGERRTPVEIALPGEPGVRATLLALGLAQALGIDRTVAAARLRGLAAPRQRLELRPLPSGASLILDGAGATEESYRIALETLSRTPARRRLALLGDISEPVPPEGSRHVELGERAAGVVERLIVVGRRFREVRRGARRGGLSPAAVTEYRNVVDAARELGRELRAGDLLLVAGRADQRVERIALALSGSPVRCAIRYCSAHGVDCATCPMLRRGWGRLRPVT